MSVLEILWIACLSLALAVLARILWRTAGRSALNRERYAILGLRWSLLCKGLLNKERHAEWLRLTKAFEATEERAKALRGVLW